MSTLWNSARLVEALKDRYRVLAVKLRVILCRISRPVQYAGNAMHNHWASQLKGG